MTRGAIGLAAVATEQALGLAQLYLGRSGRIGPAEELVRCFSGEPWLRAFTDCIGRFAAAAGKQQLCTEPGKAASTKGGEHGHLLEQR